MLAATARRLLRSHSCAYASAAPGPHSTATSLSQAVRQAETVDSLDLQQSPDLLCVNLLCEKVGDPCICRLSRVLERLQHLQRLNLANNRLISLPDSVGQLSQLQYLDLSHNKLTGLPDTMQHLRQLRVLHVEGNSDLAALPDLEALENLKMLHVDEALAETLPASLKKLIK